MELWLFFCIYLYSVINNLCEHIDNRITLQQCIKKNKTKDVQTKPINSIPNIQNTFPNRIYIILDSDFNILYNITSCYK